MSFWSHGGRSVLPLHIKLVTELRFVQQTDQDAKRLEVVHEDALLLSTSGLTLEDSNHCLITQTNAPLITKSDTLQGKMACIEKKNHQVSTDVL